MRPRTLRAFAEPRRAAAHRGEAPLVHSIFLLEQQIKTRKCPEWLRSSDWLFWPHARNQALRSITVYSHPRLPEAVLHCTGAVYIALLVNQTRSCIDRSVPGIYSSRGYDGRGDGGKHRLRTIVDRAAETTSRASPTPISSRIRPNRKKSASNCKLVQVYAPPCSPRTLFMFPEPRKSILDLSTYLVQGIPY